MTRADQIELAKERARFLVEQYLTNDPRGQVITVELLRELLTLAEKKFAAYSLLERAIFEAYPLLLTVTGLRYLPPHDPPENLPANLPVLQPAIRLVVDNSKRCA